MEDENELRDYIRVSLATGFEDWHDLPEDAADYFEDEELEEPARKLVAAEWASRVAEQAAWPAQTDCDRLDAAFAALDAAGVTARHHFACCQNCGNAEIGDEMGEGSRGYVFYHQQDTGRAAAGGSLYLAYGPTVEVGLQVVKALSEHGLTSEWSGEFASRIQVQLDWRRRIEPMPEVFAYTDAAGSFDDPTEAVITDLVDRIGAGTEQFVVLERPRLGRGDLFAQASVENGQFKVEHADGDQSVALTDDPVEVKAALIGWMSAAPGWADRLRWTPLEP